MTALVYDYSVQCQAFQQPFPGGHPLRNDPDAVCFSDKILGKKIMQQLVKRGEKQSKAV
jgi:hypothetical protein